MKRIYIYIVVLLITVGCKNETFNTLHSATDRPIKIKTQYTNGVGSVAISDEVESLTIIVCQDNSVVWLKRFSGESLAAPYVKGEFANQGTMYAIANDQVVVNMSIVGVGAPQSVLDELYTSHLQGAGNGMIGMVYNCNLAQIAQNNVIEVDLERNMARFDIVATHQAITPQSITVVGLARDGRLTKSPAVPVSTDTHSFDSTFVSPTAGGSVEGAFYCHPFDNADGFAPKIEVTAVYGDVMMKCYLDPEKAVRNTYYRILLREIDGKIEAELVADGDMESGDDSSVLPNEGVNTKIDIIKSTADPSVVIDPDGHRITFMAKGGKATIALTSTKPTELIGMDGSSSNFTITPDNGQFKLSVTANNRVQVLHPSVVLKFAAVGETDPEKYARVTVVMRSYSPVEVITMAGVDWMLVNAQGNNPMLYSLPNGAKPVARTLFTADWSKWGGVGEQWGPRAGKNGNGVITRYSPGHFTLGVDYRGMNGPIVGNVTMWDKHDYCPDGFRAPTREEFARIWPTAGLMVNDTTRGPFNYTTTKGNFTVAFEKIGGNCLVINDGVNELIFPLTGMRSSMFHYNPYTWAQTARDNGKNVYYWASDRDANSQPTVFGYVETQIYNFTVDKLPFMVNNQVMVGAHWEADAFCTTRCVRLVQ